jgi:hypothetical protein
MSKLTSAAQVRTLAKFVRDQRRVGCPVCALSVAIRGQLAEARTKGISLDLQLAWLKAEHQTSVTRDDITRHRNGRHDDAD